MSVELIYPFLTSGNYSYDPLKAEITGGKAKLKQQENPTNGMFSASYYNSIDGNIGLGNLTGTPFGGADVSGGFLDLAHSDKRYVSYDANLNADSQQAGCFRFIFKPNYITPVGESVVLLVTKEYNSLFNAIFYRDTGSHHRLHVYDKDGNLIVEAYFGYKQWVVDQEYEIEFNYDLTGGDIRMFIDGVQFGATQTGIGTRDANINLFRLGCSYQDSTNSNFKIGAIIVFSTVQHTADYTPDWSDVPETLYPIDNSEIDFNVTFRADGVDSFIETSTKAGSDEIKYTLAKDGTEYYWDGAIWKASDGTYAQANTAAEINTNAAAFTTVPITVTVKMMLHSDNGLTTPEADTVTVQYDHGGEPVDTIEYCNVFGHNFDEEGNPLTETISVQLTQDVATYKINTLIQKEVVAVTPNAAGYWDVSLVENTNMESGAQYQFTINGKVYVVTVPNETSKAFVSLI